MPKKTIPVYFEEVKMEVGFRADLIVEDKVIVELKAVEKMTPIHFKVVTNYLKISKLKVALLIIFYEELLKNGIRRIPNNY